MLNFTEYPFRWKDTGYVHDYKGGSPTTMYVHLEMYRKAGLAGLTGDGSQPIPVGMYVQQYAHLNSSVVSDREPSVSEMNLQTFAAWAFGFRKTTCFLYEDTTANLDSVLFDGAGDDTPSAKFYQIAEMNRQSLNLSNALVRLVSTDVRMKMGRHYKSRTWWEHNVLGLPYYESNPLPADSDSEVAVGAWSTSADAYLKNIIATNNGDLNHEYEGDVIVGFFKPLDASLVEAGAENDVYFMIVNGLSDEVSFVKNHRN